MANPDRSTVAGSAAIRAPGVGPPLRIPIYSLAPPRHERTIHTALIMKRRRQSQSTACDTGAADYGRNALCVGYSERVGRHFRPPHDKNECLGSGDIVSIRLFLIHAHDPGPRRPQEIIVEGAMFHLRRAAIAVLGAAFYGSIPTIAAEPVGEAVRIRTVVTGSGGPLVERDAVHRDERISTSRSGLGQFEIGRAHV